MSDTVAAVEPEDDKLGDLREWVRTSEDTRLSELTEGMRARDYYDGVQLTAVERDALKDRGQPPVIDNRIKPKINYLLGLEKRGRTDPKATPRTPEDEQGANAATDSIRFVCDDSLFEDVASAVCENILIEGMGGADVIVEMGQDGKPKIRTLHYPWDRLFYDPHSSAIDFSDARFLGGMLWMDEDGVKSQWPDASEDALSGAYLYAEGQSRAYGDRPQGMVWADAKRKRLRVIQIHWLEGGDWWRATFTAGGYLEEPEASPYQDDEGKSECSLLIQSGYVDRQNIRYGVIRDMFDPQDEVNKRRSKALHLLSVRQVISEKGAVEDVDTARQELARPDGFVEVNPGMKFEVQQQQDLAQGQFMLLQEAKASMDAAGPNAFLQGKQTQAASGRAIMASQQGGAIEIDGAIMDRFHQWKRRVYRAIWNRIRQFWTEETWVRVTDDETNVRFVGLNRVVTIGDKIASLPPEIQPQAMQHLLLVPGDPRLQEPFIGPDGQPEIEHNVASMMVDIVVDESPDVASLQSEEFMMLTDLAGKMPGLIPPEAIIQASSLRGKDKILEKMKGPTGPDGQPLPPQPPPEMLRLQAEMQAKQQQAQMQAEMDREKAGRDAEIEKMKAAAAAELDRMRLEAELELQRVRLEGELRIRELEMQGRLDLARYTATQTALLNRSKALADAELARDQSEDDVMRADTMDHREMTPVE